MSHLTTTPGLALIALLCALGSHADTAGQPNFIVINIDDLGYADIGPFGSTLNRTPNLDRMAKEGRKLTSFYAAPVCSPSRAALMTGCYPKRALPIPHVLFPAGETGLAPEEVTVAEVLKAAGYATAIVGKWHLGDQPEFLPNRQGFDLHFGLPYSNDMGPAEDGVKSDLGKPLPETKGKGQPPLPLLRNGQVVKRVLPDDQQSLVELYTTEAVQYIASRKTAPFFLYLAHNAVHFPLYPGKQWAGKSTNGIYSDWVEEVDWSVGRVLDAVREHGLADRTLVIFTSDNGGTQRAVNRPLRGFKGSTWEGGLRVPTIAWWPGRIPGGAASDAICGMFDILPTFTALAGGKMPSDRKLDGANLWPLLAGEPNAKPVHEVFYYYRGLQLEAVRDLEWKLVLPAPLTTAPAKKAAKAAAQARRTPQLFNLKTDVGETSDVAAQHPNIVARLERLVTQMEGDLGLAGPAPGSRPLGRVAHPQPLIPYDVKPEAGAAGDSGSGPATTNAARARPPAAQRQNRPEIPAVARRDAICFAYYTVNQGVLKLTAQLYPLQEGESREVKLEIKDGDAWKNIATTHVTEEPYHNYRQDKTWTAHFRVEPWDESRTTPYRVTALEGMAAYEGSIRANPVGKREIVVAAFTGNSNQDRRLKPDLIANLKAQDPDLLFFSGDQVYDHTDHLGAWLLFGRQFGEIVKDRPMISIPDDHDVGQANLWGAGGKVSTNAAGDDGGYFMPVEYVKAVERAQTWHLPDPADPALIERGIGVYFTALNWGGLSFAILEDRKFKTGPNGPLQLKPRFAPRPDWVTNADCDPKTLDLPGLKLLGERQEQFLKAWGEDWTGADFKVVLSQTIFSYATHISHGNRLLADLDSNGWPQSGRRRALEFMRRCFAFHISGDQHLGCVAQYGLDDWRDASVAFCVPSIVNYYPRKWLPLAAPARPVDGPLPNLGDYTEGFGNKLTMFTYANPAAFPAPLTNLAASASGHGLVRFDKESRKITIECWPRGVDVTQPGAKQYPGWPLTINQRDNYGRRPVAWLPEVEAPAGVAHPVVRVLDERTGELVYTLRSRTPRFKPWVFADGSYTVQIGEPPDRVATFTGQRSRKP